MCTFHVNPNVCNTGCARRRYVFHIASMRKTVISYTTQLVSVFGDDELVVMKQATIQNSVCLLRPSSTKKTPDRQLLLPRVIDVKSEINRIY
jgi:hypothetical protein